MMAEALDIVRNGLDWIERRAALFLVLGLIGLGLVGTDVVKVQLRQGGDEHAGCTIQARGLPAGHELAAAMGDLGAILNVPRAKLAAIPEPTRAKLVDLQKRATNYRAIEGTQPQSRTC